MSGARAFAALLLAASLLPVGGARADEQHDLATDIVSRDAAEMGPAVASILESQLRLTMQQKSDELRQRGVAL